MRNSLLITMLLFFGVSLIAQSHRDHIIGLSPMFSFSSNDYLDGMSLGLFIDYKYFINDIFAIGANVSPNKFNSNNMITSTPILFSLNWAPNAYYDNIRVYFGLGIGAFYLTGIVGDLSDPNKKITFGFAPEFGYYFHMSDRIYFYQMIRYNKAIYKNEDISYFSGTIGFALRL